MRQFNETLCILSAKFAMLAEDTGTQLRGKCKLDILNQISKFLLNYSYLKAVFATEFFYGSDM